MTSTTDKYSSQSIAFNTFVQVLGKAVLGLLGLFLVAFLTRSLGPEGFGLCVVLFAWVSTLIVAADMGLYLTGVRSFSMADNQKEIMENLLASRILVSCTVIIVAAFLLFFMPYEPGQKNMILLSLPSVLFVSLARAFKSWFQARLIMHFPVTAELAGCILMLLIILSGRPEAEPGEASVLNVVLALNAGTCLYSVMICWFALGTKLPGLSFQAREIRLLLGQAAPLGLSALLAILYFRFDMLMLSWLKPVQDVGVYGTAYTVVEVSAVLPALFLGSMLPVFVSSMSRGHEELRSYFQNAFSVLALFALPMLMGGFVLAEPIMELIRGSSENFQGSTKVFRILLLVSALMFWGQLNGHVLVAGGKQIVILKIYLVLVPLNILLNLLLIPAYSYSGAALATMISECFALTLTSWIIRNNFGQFPEMRMAVRGTAGACFMAVMLVVIKNYLNMNAPMMIFAGILFYSSFMLLMWKNRLKLLARTFR